ncbi:T9SS type A sorting domain-containing protein [bacterium]|nr:T9SS type A sorting domain-containing protein [bacterium]
MRSLILTLALVLSLSSFSQFSGPYRLTWDGKSYYVTNRGSGNVVEIDSAFNSSTIITGLNNPTEILFGSFGGQSAMLVLANNVIKLYDPSTFQNIWNVNISVTDEAHDIAYDPSNQNVFYISDRKGNKIVKATVGGAPLYLVSYSTLIPSIPRPAGMMFDNQGRLIVVSDTSDANIYAVNVDSASVDTILSTGLDNLNDITQDQQNNYYVTCWGDDKLYRIDRDMTSMTNLAQYNNPAGLYNNATYDYLAMTCHNCNKVEYKLYHLFSPLDDVQTCAGDSFYVDFNPTYKGIGTYGSNNKFIAQMSDSNGSFSNPTYIGQVSTDTVPKFFFANVPLGNYADTGYVYRIISTSPQVESYFTKKIKINPGPASKIFGSDTVNLCLGSTLQLGPGLNSNHTFNWSPGTLVSDSTKGKVSFVATSAGEYDIHLNVKDNTSMCRSEGEVHISVAPSLSISGLPSNLQMCQGDTVSVGINNLPYIMSWSNAPGLSSQSASNPKYYGFTSRWLFVEFSDSSSICSGTDSLYIQVDTVPNTGVPVGYSLETCTNLVLMHGLDLDTTLSYYWFGDSGITISPYQYDAAFMFTKAGKYERTVEVTNPGTGCSNSGSLEITAYYRPQVIDLVLDVNSVKIQNATGSGSNVEWTINGIPYPHLTGYSIPIDTLEALEDTVVANVVATWHVTNVNGDTLCSVESSPFVYDFSNVEELKISYNIYPNPAEDLITISASETFSTLNIYSISGQLIRSEKHAKTLEQSVDVSNLDEGMIIIEIIHDNAVSRKKVNIQR